jgi:RNA polymerase sigma-70 factor, ECF subfamily
MLDLRFIEDFVVKQCVVTTRFNSIAKDLPLAVSCPIRQYSFEGCLLKMPCNHDADTLANIDGLYSYALALTRNRAEAEDLVEETCARALRAAGWWRAGSNTKAWLFTILRNGRLNQLRKRRASPQFIGIEDCDAFWDGIAEPSKDAHNIYITKTEARRIQAAIQKLPLACREVILLREYEDLSYREIAGVLNCPVGTVMCCLATAREMLRTLLFETLSSQHDPE